MTAPAPSSNDARTFGQVVVALVRDSVLSARLGPEVPGDAFCALAIDKSHANEIAAAVTAERERCAKVVEDMFDHRNERAAAFKLRAAKAIRAAPPPKEGN